MHITLLIHVSEAIEDSNYLRLANALLERNAQVSCCFMDSLSMVDSKVTADGFDLVAPLQDGQPFPNTDSKALAESDVIWTLTLGMRHSFLDKIQLLKCLEEDCQLINSVDALMHLKSKYSLASHSDVFQYPATYTSTNPTVLADIIKDKGGQWIAKPPAGSLGRDIFLLSSDDPNLKVILETMTGPESDQYCLLQPYVDEISRGEKRVLIAGGQPVGQYLRLAQSDHRTNVTSGAATEPCDLTAEERAYCESIGEFLLQQGAYFVGLDLAYPWVIEFNVVNPGGIHTILELGGPDLSPEIIAQIFGKSDLSA